MKKFMTFFVAASLSLAANAQATVIDFVAEAAGNERGVANGTTISFNGIDITFDAGENFAYFDDLSQGLPAGLGVCQALTGPAPAECAVSGDDNIHDSSEAVALTFLNTMTLSAHSFSDADHMSLNSNNTNTLLIAINTPGDFQRYTFTQAVGLVIAGVELIQYAYDPSESGVAFYVNGFEAVSGINGAVPLPAAAPLLLFGLGGLGFAARRKRSTA